MVDVTYPKDDPRHFVGGYDNQSWRLSGKGKGKKETRAEEKAGMANESLLYKEADKVLKRISTGKESRQYTAENFSRDQGDFGSAIATAENLMHYAAAHGNEKAAKQAEKIYDAIGHVNYETKDKAERTIGILYNEFENETSPEVYKIIKRTKNSFQSGGLERLAAGILGTVAGVTGIIMATGSSSITGNVIGASGNTQAIVGIGLFILGIFMITWNIHKIKK